MDSDLSLEFLRVVEQAAIACAHTMGNGDRHKSDQVAVEAMRAVMDTVPIDGTIVIGEGERDEAPMLYIGEKVGLVNAKGIKSLGMVRFSEVDIAVDPLEGTNLCATGAPNAIAVLAASEKGGLLHAPDLYMEKLVVGPTSKDHVSLDAPVAENLKAIAKALGRDVDDLVVIVLDRERQREADRRHPRNRRAHPPDRGRRSLGGHHGGGGGFGRPRRDGHGRRAGRRVDGRRDALPQRRDLRAARGGQARARGALPRDGHHRFQEGVSRRRISRRARASFLPRPASPTGR